MEKASRMATGVATWPDVGTPKMQTPSPPPHRPLGRTLIAGAGVIGFAFLGAVVLYFATVGLLYLRSNFVVVAGRLFGAMTRISPG